MEERLQKYMASCGVASRRSCEQLILQGLVKVNGVVVKELGVKVNGDIDEVQYNGQIIKPEGQKVYYALNKPSGYITSVKDEKGRKTILDIVKVKERIFPIGRLDYDSEGLLILTNDGSIYNNLIHPRVKLKKVYIAECEGNFSKKDLESFSKGIDIGGYTTAPAEIKVLSESNNGSVVEISIHEGKNRQIRKMCSALNHEVKFLKRIRIGELELGYLKKGQYRTLSKEELEYIRGL